MNLTDEIINSLKNPSCAQVAIDLMLLDGSYGISKMQLWANMNGIETETDIVKMRMRFRLKKPEIQNRK